MHLSVHFLFFIFFKTGASHEREISVQQFCAVFHGNKILIIITHEKELYESVGRDPPDHMHYEFFLKKLFLYFISVKNCASDLHIAIGHHPLHHGSPKALWRRT